ncbi:MAG TPA: hypothetical protein PLW02_03020 [Verrucomicrobiota bacterium]|nr:hypothetical protein [Verrucomicrobiota bacterium]
MKKLIVLLILFVVTGTITVLTTGCGTVAEDSSNVSTRPWNTPKSWEGPLPSTFNEGR